MIFDRICQKIAFEHDNEPNIIKYHSLQIHDVFDCQVVQSDQKFGRIITYLVGIFIVSVGIT